jgi:hypothetical protein
MTFWWKLGIAALIVIALVDFGMYFKGKIDEAEQASALRDQIKATAELNHQLQQKSEQAEARQAADRQVITDLNQKWSAARAKKTHPDCGLDADSLSLLGQATVPHTHGRPGQPHGGL